MLRKSIISAIIFIASVGAVNAADVKVGIVDMQEIGRKLPQLQNINKKVVDQFNERREQLEQLVKKSEEIQEKVKRDAMTLTNQQKLQYRRELQALKAEYELKEGFFNEDIQAANNIEQAKVMQKINDAISKVAKDEKFDLVLRKNSAHFFKESFDVTEKVIKILSNPAG